MATGANGLHGIDVVQHGGIQDKTRKCDAPQPSNGGLYCNGIPIKSRPFHGQWGSWKEWESCNTNCRNGFKNRSRNFDSPSPMFGGSDCIGLDFYIQMCNQDICLGTERQGKEEASKSFSIEVLVGVAVGCICITAVVIFIALFAFHRFRSVQLVIITTKTLVNWETLSDQTLKKALKVLMKHQAGDYETYEIKRSDFATTQFNNNNQAIYENMKIK
ncbi:unnamed protein product [Mytilus coruscus]|uniref:HMCN n=1 Tax=Mytilus coruscus TaxID=42192 RepID=A0A6J8EQR9_MYTCO|nr:unnamed protein product [Mytilus coruscus]